MWMTLFSCQLAYSLYLARKLIMATRNKKRSHLLIFMLIGWGVPLVITILAIVLNYRRTGVVRYGALNNRGISCWLNDILYVIILFVVPMVFCLLVNLCMFVAVTVFVCQSLRKGHEVRPQNNSVLIRLWLALFVITGFTLMFGFIAIPEATSWVWYPFVILNSTQGFSIFLVFIFTKRTFKLYSNLIIAAYKKVMQSGGESSPDTISNTLPSHQVQIDS